MGTNAHDIRRTPPHPSNTQSLPCRCSRHTQAIKHEASLRSRQYYAFERRTRQQHLARPLSNSSNEHDGYHLLAQQEAHRPSHRGDDGVRGSRRGERGSHAPAPPQGSLQSPSPLLPTQAVRGRPSSELPQEEELQQEGQEPPFRRREFAQQRKEPQQQQERLRRRQQALQHP